MKKQLFLSFFLILQIYTTTSAQDLHIYYDVFHDSLWYKKDGMITETPGVRKRDLVQLHIIEFNNYLYNIKTEQKEVSEEAGQEDVFNSLISQAQGSMEGLFKNLPLGNIGAGFANIKISDYLGLGGQEEGARGGSEMLEQANSARDCFNELQELSGKMDRLSSELISLSRSIFAGTLSTAYIDELLMSPDLPPTQVKQLVMEQLELMFGEEFVDNPTLAGALAWKVKVDSFRVKSARMYQRKKQWDVKKLEYDKSILQMSHICNYADTLQRKTLNDYKDKLDIINIRDGMISGYADDLIKIEEMAASVTPDKLGALYRKTLEVKNHRFEYNQTFKPIGREMDLVLNITPRGSNEEADADSYRTRTIRVMNYEGFKYTITPGFCVAGFFTPQKRYSVALNNDNETVIAETDADKFVPLVTTAVQVYNDRGKRVTPGALLGLAVPLTPNGGQSQSLNFVLGPSLVIGRDQRISISLGFMGGKTTRLSEGVTPFQPFDTQNGVRPIPTVERYEFGWYFGITGNL
jgi:hypothetical protein